MSFPWLKCNNIIFVLFFQKWWFQIEDVQLLKAILRLFIYKALYDETYLGSKTTMTTGEWSCLISFAWDPLTCSERRRGSEKFRMKIYVSSGIRTHASPRHVEQRFRPLGYDTLMKITLINVLMDSWIKLIKPLRDNTGQSDCGYIIHVLLNWLSD